MSFKNISSPRITETIITSTQLPLADLSLLTCPNMMSKQFYKIVLRVKMKAFIFDEYDSVTNTASIC